MLQNFVQQKRNGGDGDDLHVFYLVVGILKVEGDPLSMVCNGVNDRLTIVIL